MSDPRSYGASNGGGPLSGPADRRRACRYRVGLSEGSLGWWEETSFVVTPCRIVDISLVGCKVESHPHPNLREQQPVWFRPPGISPSDWTGGIIIAVRRPWFRRWRIRIRFLEHLPYSTFKPLVFGTQRPRGTAVPEAPEHEKDHFWR